MAREASAALLCAALCVVALVPTPSRAADPDSPLTTALAVQAALSQGRDCIGRGNYAQAVNVLEAQIARINGSGEYLAALGAAYRGYIKELRQANRDDEARIYLRRLEVLDAGAVLEFPPQKSVDPPANPIKPPPEPVATKTIEAPPVPKSVETPTNLVPPVSPSRPPLTVRGIRSDKEDDDPFHPSNRLSLNPGTGLVGQADQEFRDGHYETAGRLYDQANRADPKTVTGAARENWAYCKLAAIKQQWERHGATSDDKLLAGYESEIRTALTLTTSPQLKQKGADWLGEIQEARRGGAAVRVETPAAVKQLDRVTNGWSVAESENFRVYHRNNPDLAERAAQTAERARRDVSHKWFNDDGEKWTDRCELYLHATAQEYSKATGKPASWPAHTTVQRETGRIVQRRIDLHCDDREMLSASLPHEATHAVLASRFGGVDLPRWADEGLAMLTEPRDRLDRYQRILNQAREDRLVMSMRELLTLDNYPTNQTAALAFYAQSVSVSQYLSELQGPQTLAKFLSESLKNGTYEPALKKYYSLDLPTLEQRWRTATFGDGASQSTFRAQSVSDGSAAPRR
jgi:tetratricopeptide (TPR) repeat protein